MKRYLSFLLIFVSLCIPVSVAATTADKNQHWTVMNHLGIINHSPYEDSPYIIMKEDAKDHPLNFGQLVSMIHTMLLTELTVNDYGTIRTTFLLGEVVSRQTP